MRRACLVLACLALVSLLAGCGSDSEGSDDPTTTSAKPADPVEMGEAPIDAAGCARYTTLIQLFDELDTIATGASSTQVAADTEAAASIEALADQPGADREVADALDTLSKVSFQVSATDGGPSAEDQDAALATLSDAFAHTCADLTPTATTAEPPATDETTTTVGTEPATTGTTEVSGGQVDECPAPETLEAEGYQCDSEGNLTPISGGQVLECPAPEVLAAEGYTCDAEGNLTPVG